MGGGWSPEHAAQFTNDPTSGVQSWHKVAENPPNWEKVLQRNLALKKPDIDKLEKRQPHRSYKLAVKGNDRKGTLYMQCTQHDCQRNVCHI